MLKNSSWGAYAVALAGGAVFAIQLWIYAHTQTSFLDEGAYSYMGYQFALGTYHPYRDYGLWMNYAPLSYLIPGYVQLWFGPGLRTGRYFAVLLAILTLVALWITARRLGGKWWAAALVWAVAITPIPIKIYSHVLSEVLVSFFLAWLLLCVLGEKRPLWQIIIGSFLAGMLVMTRHTMIPLLPLLVAYVFWQHGRKAGWYSIIGCLLPLLVIHIIFWPNILQLWSFYWLPTQWIPFLNKFRPLLDNVPALAGSLNPRTQLMAFFSGFQAHYIVLVGAIATVFLWPHLGQWKNPASKRAAIFLAVLFFLLLIIHGWGSLGFNSCPYCFVPYITFFNSPALLLVIVSFPSWNKTLSIPRQIQIILVLALISFGIGFAAMEQLGEWLLRLNVPRIHNGIKFGEWVTLWDYVSNKLHIEYFPSRILLSSLFCLTVCFLALGILFLVHRFAHRRGIRTGYSFAALALVVFLAGGYIISPLLNGPYYDCNVDVLQNYEAIGSNLKALIPPGSHVYWAVQSAAPLLYLPNVHIHSAQVYGWSTYLRNNDSEQVEKAGYWNDELDQRWLAEADFLIVENAQLAGPLKLDARIDSALYELTTLPATNPCVSSNRLLVFRRIR